MRRLVRKLQYSRAGGLLTANLFMLLLIIVIASTTILFGLSEVGTENSYIDKLCQGKYYTDYICDGNSNNDMYAIAWKIRIYESGEVRLYDGDCDEPYFYGVICGVDNNNLEIRFSRSHMENAPEEWLKSKSRDIVNFKYVLKYDTLELTLNGYTLHFKEFNNKQE